MVIGLSFGEVLGLDSGATREVCFYQSSAFINRVRDSLFVVGER